MVTLFLFKNNSSLCILG